MPAQTVLLIGCGIASPVLALLLKRKGYRPIVFEKVKQLGDAGASLMINPNGNKVLGLFGLDKELHKLSIPLSAHQDFISDGSFLGGTSIPAAFAASYGYEAIGIKRTELNLLLRDRLIAEGIVIHEGWALESIDHGKDLITAHFSNGESVFGAFLCGSDGIRSKTRDLLLSAKGVIEAVPTYTGLSQTAGISPTPAALQGTSAMRNWYGDGVHVIAYPVSATHTSWAITQIEKEQTKETWRLYHGDGMLAIQKDLMQLLSEFDESVLQLVRNIERLTKYGLYDREELVSECWYTERCILVGDAAHPTSPHLGQGANQALEDCYHLVSLLPDASSTELGSAFQQFATSQQPRTTSLVKGARLKGEQRVKSGEECGPRNEMLRDSWAVPDEQIWERFDALFKGRPFETAEEGGLR